MAQCDTLHRAVLTALLEAPENTGGTKGLSSEAQQGIEAKRIVLACPIQRAPKDLANALESGCFTHYFDACRLNGLKKSPKWKALRKVVEYAASRLHGIFSEFDPEMHTSGGSKTHPSTVTHAHLALPQGQIMIAMRVS
jgi:hypothetical protein